MQQDPLFERLWNGTAPMEEWTQAVCPGALTSVAENIVAIHTTYFCGSVTAIRTAAGLVLLDTAKPDTAALTLATLRRWDNGPIHTVIYTHGHIDHTSGIKVIDQEADARGVPRPRIIAHRNVLRRLNRYEASHGFNSIVQGQQFNFRRYVYPIGQRRPGRGLRRHPLAHDRQREDRVVSWARRDRRCHFRLAARAQCPGQRGLRDLGVPECRKSAQGPTLRAGLGARAPPDAGVAAGGADPRSRSRGVRRGQGCADAG